MFRRAIHIYKYIRTTNGARLFLKKCAHHRLRRRVYKRLGSGAEVRLFARVCARVSGRRVAAASRRRVQRIKEPGGPDARQPGGGTHKPNDTPPKNPPVVFSFFVSCTGAPRRRRHRPRLFLHVLTPIGPLPSKRVQRASAAPKGIHPQ
jgi:hypothetical protein